MMKRTLFAVGFFLLSAPAWAACGVTNLQVKDNAGTTANVPYADDGAGATNCSPQIQIKQGGNVAAVTAGSALKTDSSAVTQPVSVASGGVASGAYAAGSLASGAGVDGWDLTKGAKADAVCGTPTGTCSLIALTKFIANGVNSAIPAGTNNIGGVELIDSGGTNKLAVASNGAAAVQGVAGMTPVFTSNDPCSQALKTTVPIATSSGNLQLVAGVSAKKVYICSFALIAAATAVVNIIEGTGAACTTANEAAVFGSTTAASGASLAANGGLTLGNGGGTVGVTATAANGICLLQSGTTALAGNITYVQQ